MNLITFFLFITVSFSFSEVLVVTKADFFADGMRNMAKKISGGDCMFSCEDSKEGLFVFVYKNKKNVSLLVFGEIDSVDFFVSNQKVSASDYAQFLTVNLAGEEVVEGEVVTNYDVTTPFNVGYVLKEDFFNKPSQVSLKGGRNSSVTLLLDWHSDLELRASFVNVEK